MNELTVRRELTPSTWNMIQAAAPVIHESRLFGMNGKEQAAAIMLKGYELGLGLAASFEFIHVIQGKPAINPRGALALIQQSPLCAGIKITDNVDGKGNPESCTVWMKRTNGYEYTVTFSMADAEKAGLVKPDSGWTKYPANMLRWRAVGFCADVVFPDVIGGLKRADEYGADLTPGGDVIEGQSWTVPQPSSHIQYQDQQTAQQQPAPVNAVPVPTLDDLLKQYSPEQIMAANDGRIPGSVEEIQAVVEALKS